MKKLYLALMIATSVLLTGCGFGTIESGNVGVRTQFGKVQQEEEREGLYVAVLSSVVEYTAKETNVVLSNMTPKAKDKLILKDLDVAVYYRANPTKIAEFASSHAAMSAKLKDEDFVRPGYNMIDNMARGVISDEVSKFDSLTLHQNRSDLETAIKKALSDELNKTDPGYFEITRVVVTSLLTDPAVEESIRKNIQMNNEIDTARKEIDKKKQEADAMAKTAAALTPALLQHEFNAALMECAKRQGCTLIVDGSRNGSMLNIRAGQ